MSLDDDQLLDALNRAIGPDLEARPSPAERDALRQVVLQAGRTTSAAADTTGTAGPLRPGGPGTSGFRASTSPTTSSPPSSPTRTRWPV